VRENADEGERVSIRSRRTTQPTSRPLALEVKSEESGVDEEGVIEEESGVEEAEEDGVIEVEEGVVEDGVIEEEGEEVEEEVVTVVEPVETEDGMGVEAANKERVGMNTTAGEVEVEEEEE
jgi:hypothetical protein